MALGDLEGAIADFDKSIRFNGKFVDAYTSRGLAKFEAEDLEGADDVEDELLFHFLKSGAKWRGDSPTLAAHAQVRGARNDPVLA